MLTRVCDRCHQPIPGAVNYGWVCSTEAGIEDPDTHDLCLACLKALREWMGQPEVAG